MISLTVNAMHMDRACSEVHCSEALCICGNQSVKTVLEDQSEEWQDADASGICAVAIAKVAVSEKLHFACITFQGSISSDMINVRFWLPFIAGAGVDDALQLFDLVKSATQILRQRILKLKL